MAKQKLSVFSKTEAAQPGDLGDLDSGTVRPIGIGLREGAINALDEIAAQYSISRGGVMRLAIYLFIKDFRAGKVDLSEWVKEPLPTKNRIVLPK